MRGGRGPSRRRACSAASRKPNEDSVLTFLDQVHSRGIDSNFHSSIAREAGTVDRGRTRTSYLRCAKVVGSSCDSIDQREQAARVRSRVRSPRHPRGGIPPAVVLYSWTYFVAPTKH